MIVDVDTHWEATSYASDEFPLAPWRDRLPGSLDMLAFGIAGDLLRALPEADRPSATELLPNLVRMAEERGGPIILHPLHDSSPAERVAWMDRIGIDHCLVNPGGYWQQLEFLGADRARRRAPLQRLPGRAAGVGVRTSASGGGRRLRRRRRRGRGARAGAGAGCPRVLPVRPSKGARRRRLAGPSGVGPASGPRRPDSAWSP